VWDDCPGCCRRLERWFSRTVPSVHGRPVRAGQALSRGALLTLSADCSKGCGQGKLNHLLGCGLSFVSSIGAPIAEWAIRVCSAGLSGIRLLALWLAEGPGRRLPRGADGLAVGLILTYQGAARHAERGPDGKGLALSVRLPRSLWRLRE